MSFPAKGCSDMLFVLMFMFGECSNGRKNIESYMSYHIVSGTFVMHA